MVKSLDKEITWWWIQQAVMVVWGGGAPSFFLEAPYKVGCFSSIFSWLWRVEAKKLPLDWMLTLGETYFGVVCRLLILIDYRRSVTPENLGGKVRDHNIHAKDPSKGHTIEKHRSPHRYVVWSWGTTHWGHITLMACPFAGPLIPLEGSAWFSWFFARNFLKSHISQRQDLLTIIIRFVHNNINNSWNNIEYAKSLFDRY